MTTDEAFKVAQPSFAVLRWLTNPGRHVPAHIRDVLLGELFASTGAIIAAVVCTSVVNVAALALHGGRIFGYLLLADFTVGALRLLVIHRVFIARKTGRPTPTNFHLITSITWSAVLGAVGFFAMSSNIPALQIIATANTIAIAGGSPRFYPAPRLALLMFSLVVLPFMAATLVASDHFLRVLGMMTPMYYFAAIAMIARLQKMAVAFLQASHDSKLQARLDPLTGLLNRHGLNEVLRDHSLAEVPRMILFYLDLDGFKQVNDRYGHLVGDKLLQLVAERLAAATRGADVSARVGGDEFVVIAPGMPPEDAEGFAGRLIRAIEAPYWLEEAGEARIGVSIGYACAPEDSTTLAGLYRQADAALYGVKASVKGTTRRFGVPA